MHRYLTIGHRLPHFLSARLFGDRKRWGLRVRRDDPCWIEWTQKYLNFYCETQKKSIGASVNDAGYRVLENVEFDNKKVLEIGPGVINHLPCWWNKYEEEPEDAPYYIIADVKQEMLDRSSEVLAKSGVPHESKLIQEKISSLPFANNEFDMIVTFYALEHINPLETYLDELKRVLKSDGILVGAIPAEGGLAWGLGRFFTSRRWLKKNTNIDPDKIICWEHPNFADSILKCLGDRFEEKSVRFWPLRVPMMDFNLVLKFIYMKR